MMKIYQFFFKNNSDICDAIWEKGSTIQVWKSTRWAIEEIAAAPNVFIDSFPITHILQNSVDKKFLIGPH